MPTPPSSKPSFATKPTVDAPSEVDGILALAKVLHLKLMPWQHHVIKIATQKRPNGTYRYPTVILTVPRQSGKTTLLALIMLYRSLSKDGRQTFYTAQTGKDAGERWRDLVKVVENSEISLYAKAFFARGNERLDFINGSRISPFAPTAESLHGYTPHEVIIDEAFKFDEYEGSDLMGAILPAQITVTDKQLWIVSTAGNADSHFLRRQVDNGREATKNPDKSDVAYFEWSLEAEKDPFNPDNWGFHPALGHTIGRKDLETVLASKAMSPQEFRRAFMNQWVETKDTIIARDDWQKANEGTIPLESIPWAKTIVSFDIGLRRAYSGIVASWRDGDATHSQVLAYERGSYWLEDSLARLREYNPFLFVADDGGSNRQLIETLKGKDFPLEALSGRSLIAMTTGFLEAVKNGTYKHDGSDALEYQALNVGLADGGQNGSKISRKHSNCEIPLFYAAAVGYYYSVTETIFTDAPVTINI